MSASDYGDHVHRSPAQRHRAKREQWANRAKRKRAQVARDRQEREQARQRKLDLDAYCLAPYPDFTRCLTHDAPWPDGAPQCDGAA